MSSRSGHGRGSGALALVIASLWGALGCGPAGVEGPPSQAPAPQVGVQTFPPLAASALPRTLPDDVDLEITLSPESPPETLVRVKLAARKLDIPLGTWESPRVLDIVGNIEASDDMGPLDAVLDKAAPGTRLAFGRAPLGTLRLSYAIKAQLPAFPNPPLVAIDPDRFEAAGEALLLLPAALEERSVRATVRIESDEIGTPEMTSAASSFGLGAKVQVTARGVDLRSGFFLAGLLGRATFQAPEGNDDAAWLGYTAFDPRPVVADMAGLRTSLRQMFGAADAERVSFLFLSDTRPEGEFVVARRPRSIVARIGVQERWNAPLRIAVATAVVHGWIGSRLWIGPNDPAREMEAYWFSEGVARSLARDLLFRYGLISPADAAQEVEGLASVIATSPRSNESNEELRKKPSGALPLLVARGALYALRIDAQLRAKTSNKRSLQTLLRELFTRAAAEKNALPTSAWTDALVKDLGDGERAAFHDAIELGKSFELPDSALGPCFKRVTRTYATFDLGFDEEATLKSTPRKITELAPGGPADKAGLRPGDDLVLLLIDRRSADSDVQVTVMRDDATKIIKYKPRGKSAKGPGFERRKEIADDACTP